MINLQYLVNCKTTSTNTMQWMGNVNFSEPLIMYMYCATDCIERFQSIEEEADYYQQIMSNALSREHFH